MVTTAEAVPSAAGVRRWYRFATLYGCCILTVHILSSSSKVQTTIASNGNTTRKVDRSAIQRPFCTSDQVAWKGRWKPIALPRGAPYQPSTILDPGTGCYEQYPNASVAFSQRPWHTYEWQVNDDDNCYFTRFDRNTYCDIMRDKTLVVVGDSLSYEHFASLGGLLGIDVNPFRRLIFRQRYYHIVFRVCDDFTSTLVWQSTVSYHEKQANQSLTYPVPDVVVLNVGAHYKPDDEFISMRESNLRRFQTWQAEDPERLLIYRTTVPGHPNCESYAEPPANATVATMEAIINSSSPPTHHWEDFRRQNDIVLSLLANSTLRYDVIRAYEVNILRPDNHPSSKDCLHSCEMTGKMEFYNDSLLHILRAQFGQGRASNVPRTGSPPNTKVNVG